jgi:leader peptidase (prepilin peptidase)/N-methyltransferase
MAAVVGAVVGIVVLSVQRQSRATPIAFGPFLAAAGWIMLIAGPEIVDRYLGFFGPRP